MLTYLAYGYKLRLYDSSSKYYVYIYTLMLHTQHLLCVTYIILCTGFVLEIEDYPLSVWLLNPPFIPFSPGVNAISGLQTYILRCNSIRLCICTLDLSNTSSELCNSFLSIHIILNRKVMYCITFKSLCNAI